MSWYINGVRHIGPIVTVKSSGGDYNGHEALGQAIRETVDNTLILVYSPTEYSEYIINHPDGSSYVSDRRLYIKSMSPQIKIQNYNNTIFSSNSNTIIEDFIIDNVVSWRSFIIHLNSIISINKCNFDMPGSYGVVFNLTGNSNSGMLSLINCYMRNTFDIYQIASFDLSKVCLNKCELDTVFNGYDCTGSLLQSDYVTTPTTDYGYNYGTNLITEVGDPIYFNYYEF